MSYTAGNLHLRAGAPGDLTYTYDASSDSMATVLIDGYFNNSDDDLNLTAEDQIWCQCSDGNMWLRVSAVASGSVTTQYAGGNLPIQTFASGTGTAAGLYGLAVGYYEIGTSIATSTRMILPLPYPGAEIHVTKVDTGTRSFLFHAGGSVGIATTYSGATGVTFDAEGNRVITVRVEGESFHVVGSSTSRWRIQNMHYVSSAGSCATEAMISSIGNFISGT